MKILHCIYGLNIGGAETFLLEMINASNQSYAIDIMVRDDGICRNKNLNEVMKRHNTRVFVAPGFPKHIIKNYRYVNQILSDEDYDIIHIHANALIYVIPIVVAIRKNVKIVLHSHNSKSAFGIIGKLVHQINKLLFANTPMVRVACSEVAGRWMFGKKDFEVLDNAVDIEKYKFNVIARETIRKRYHIPKSTIVIGHVGRFVEAKNHKFILDIFEKFSKENDAVLLLVGDGKLKEKIEKEVKYKCLEDKVIFVGFTDCVSSYLSAMDLMLFPSLYEGLPFTLIEAQISGLPVLASENVSFEVKIVNNVQFENLESDVSVWCDKIIKLLKNNIDRTLCYKNVENTKYDSRRMFRNLIKIYES